jgi:hypothetical protein
MDWIKWTDEKEFFRRYEWGKPLAKKQNYERFITKYKTIFNWFCVLFNRKEQIWQNLIRDYENDKLDCYQIRLEEIINT